MQAMEEAVPFLEAVDARDVPDYYDVIKVHHSARCFYALLCALGVMCLMNGRLPNQLCFCTAWKPWTGRAEACMPAPPAECGHS